MIYHPIKRSRKFKVFRYSQKSLKISPSTLFSIPSPCACGPILAWQSKTKFELQLYKDRQNSNVLISFGSVLWKIFLKIYFNLFKQQAIRKVEEEYAKYSKILSTRNLSPRPDAKLKFPLLKSNKNSATEKMSIAILCDTIGNNLRITWSKIFNLIS